MPDHSKWLRHFLTRYIEKQFIQVHACKCGLMIYCHYVLGATKCAICYFKVL